MKHTLAELGIIFGAHKVSPAPALASKPATGRDVIMRITLDAQHAMPLRQALSRDCAGQSWTVHEKSPHDQHTIAHLLIEDHVLLGLDVADRESLFAQLGEFLEHRHGLAAASVVTALAARETLGSTALGQGVAVPHGQIRGLHEALALYARPLVPIPFDAPDGAPVSDLVALFVPEWANTTHLHLLAQVAERFYDQRFREQLHACGDSHAVCRLFADFEASDAGEHASIRSKTDIARQKKWPLDP